MHARPSLAPQQAWGMAFLSFNVVWCAAPAVTVSEGGLAHTRAYTHSRALTFNSQSPAAALVAVH